MMQLERPTPPLEGRLPRRPGPGAVRVLCKCGNWIGEREGGWFFVVYRGRQQTSPLPCEVTCEKCHKRNLVS